MMRNAADRFFAGPRITCSTSAGDVQLPITYHDVTNVVAMFWGSRAVAAQFVARAGLQLALARRDRALVALSFYEYRETSIGSYNEVGLAVFAVPPEWRRMPLGLAELYAPLTLRRLGAHVIDLPVTTAAANAAGRELWGYPKFVTKIPFELRGRAVRGSVLDPDRDGVICSLEGLIGRGVPAPPMSLMTYSRRDGELLRTHVNVRGRVTIGRPGTVVLRVGASQHRMAANLRALGLDDARPLAVLASDRFQSVLHRASRADGARGD